MDLRKEDVVVETDRYRIAGKMTLPSEGLGSRLSDHVNRRDVQFLTIQDATLSPLDGGEAHTESRADGCQPPHPADISSRSRLTGFRPGPRRPSAPCWPFSSARTVTAVPPSKRRDPPTPSASCAARTAAAALHAVGYADAEPAKGGGSTPEVRRAA